MSVQERNILKQRTADSLMDVSFWVCWYPRSLGKLYIKAIS